MFCIDSGRTGSNESEHAANANTAVHASTLLQACHAFLAADADLTEALCAMLAYLRYVTSTLSASMACAVLLTYTYTIVRFMAQLYTLWHRCSLYGTAVHLMKHGSLHDTVVYFMAPTSISWHYFWIHGTASEFLCTNACMLVLHT